MSTRTLLAAACSAAVTAGAANAAITFDGIVAQSDNEGALIFDASGSDKLVVFTTIEHHFGPGNLTGNINGITYNGEALTKAVEEPTGGLSTGGTSDIWYLDNPGNFTGTNEIVLSRSGNNYSIQAIGLSGTAAGVGNVAAGDGVNSINLDAAADSLVIVGLGLGGNGNTAGSGNVTPDAPLTLGARETRSSNWVGNVSGYATGSGGVASYSFTDGANPDRTDVSIVAAEFTAIPEPGSLALLGLGGLLIARRRRG